MLVIAQSYSSKLAIDDIGEQFEKLSEQALPLSMNNAKIIQNILEQIKLLNNARSEDSLASLENIVEPLEAMTQEANAILNELYRISENYPDSLTKEQKEALSQMASVLKKQSVLIIDAQKQSINTQLKIDDLAPSFQYGVGSIGPEMTRIASFLVKNNPEAYDAANRFSSQSSDLKSIFLLLMMQSDKDMAMKQYKEMRTRQAGIDLAFEDLAELYPEIKEFASLTAPLEMVKEGFQAKGILPLILAKLEFWGAQSIALKKATSVADEMIVTLNEISHDSSEMIQLSAKTVHRSMNNIIYLVLAFGVVLSTFVLVSGVFLRYWIRRGLGNLTNQMGRVAEHHLDRKADLVGPSEMKLIATKLNQIIESTQESISMVTNNCTSLHSVAGNTYASAELTNKNLLIQNNALISIDETFEQLQSSIKEITKITNDLHVESQKATESVNHGVKAVEKNSTHLFALEGALKINEERMISLNHSVEQISDMVEIITNIADRTNLLALNAAIEAARAGEHGRGFAVVADEVRQLASGTNEQTENIRTMMLKLVKSVNVSQQSVGVSREEMTLATESNKQVKNIFDEIESAVNLLRDRFEQVSVTTEEQERATKDVNTSLNQITEQSARTKLELDSMVKGSKEVSDIIENQKMMLAKYEL